jgi:hypothetical protein|tara:strand:- start:358 stop:1014 length:657 start_codon:yes stop_codon:yes gene_type:complete
MEKYEQGPHSKVRRLPERAHYDEETIHSIIDSALICHVGFTQGGRPFVIPCIHGRGGRTVYLHGAKASRLLGEAGSGMGLCLAFTSVDGIVLARSSFHSSMNYRSVVAFGSGRKLEGTDKVEGLKAISDSLVQGRWEEAREPTEKELLSTSVVAVDIDQATAKIRTGGANDDEEDLNGPWWAGVLPLERRFLEPVPSEDLKAGVGIPKNVSDRIEGGF